ncbi:MAG: hypothetical protein ACTHN5_16080 [Phycisphaerae bacterium]
MSTVAKTRRRIRLTYIHPVVPILGSMFYLYFLILQYTHTGTFAILPNEPQVFGFRFILCATVVGAGLSRYLRYHPASHIRYGRWLMSTPWTSKDPLPLGPPTLAWQDLLFCALIVAIDRFHLHGPGSLPLIVFLLAYYFPSWMLFFTTGAVPHALILFAAIPPILIFLHDQWIILACLAALYIVHHLGTRATLRKFPWRLGESQPKLPLVDWPFSRLAPIEVKPTSLRVILITSLLAGWEVFCFTSLIDLPPSPETYPTATLMIVIFGAVIAAGRLFIYAKGTKPPLTLFGRFATGRFIIPRHDQIFLAPAATFIIACLLAATHPHALPFNAAWAISATLLIFISCILPPSLHVFQLTGAFMITRPPMPQPRPQQQKSFRLTTSGEMQ